jgi:hypothetical protein
MAPARWGRSRMGACETTPATSHEPGKATGDPLTRQPSSQGPRSSLPMIGRRLTASSSFVLACALRAHRLRALQLDPRPRDSTNRQRRGNTATAVPPHTRRLTNNQVTGLIQHCLLTTESPWVPFQDACSASPWPSSPTPWPGGCMELTWRSRIWRRRVARKCARFGASEGVNGQVLFHGHGQKAAAIRSR